MSLLAEDGVFDLSNYFWSPYALPPLVVGMLIALLGLAVLWRERASRVSLAFCAMTTSGAVWLLGYGVTYLTPEWEIALIWIRALHLGVTFIPSTVYLFTLAVLHQLHRYRRFVWGSFLLSGFFFLSCLFTDWLIQGFTLYFWGYYARYGILSIPFLAFFFMMMAVCLRLFARGYFRATSDTQRQRMKAFLPAFSIAYLGSFDFLPTFGAPLYPFGYLPVFIFVVMAAQAIWLYRLVDITPAFAAQEIMDTMTEALFVLDREGVIRLANRTACELFGLSHRNLVGSSASWTIGGRIFSEQFDDLMKVGAIRNYEMEYLTQAGVRRTLSLSASVMRNPAEEPMAVVCIARDVTERKQFEQLIQDAKVYAESIVETLREPLVVLDGELRVKTSNRSFYQTFQFSPAQTENRFLTELGSGQWDLPELRTLLGEVLHQDASFQDFEMEREFPGIGQRTMLLNARRIRQEEGTPPLILLAIEDITQIRQMQRELIQSEKLAALGKFSSGLAHEVKNPLGIILGGVEFLERKLSTAEDPDIREALEKIKESTLRADTLVKGLLQFSRPSPLKIDKIKPEELIEETLALLRYRASLENISIETFFFKEEGDLRVEVDKNQIQQVLFNIFMNAVEAMPQGGKLRIKTYPTTLSNSGHPKFGYCIEAADTGEGIPKENLSRIFEPFFTTKAERKGTGLGLSVAKIITERHGGSLKVESEPSKGTTVRIVLPLAKKEVEVG